MADTIKFLKGREVKSPSRAYDFDAGIDFYVPEFTAEFIKDLKEKNPLIWPKDNYAPTIEPHYRNPTLTMHGDTKVVYDLYDDNNTCIKFDDTEGKNYFLLAPGSRVNIPSGIKSRMAEPGRALIAFNKSGIATKYGLIAGACVSSETIIETNKGKFTAITLTPEFINLNEILIKGYDEKTKTYNFYKFDGFRFTGEKKCIKFTFENNETLICSEEHELLTNNGWKFAKNISETDILIQ